MTAPAVLCGEGGSQMMPPVGGNGGADPKVPPKTSAGGSPMGSCGEGGMPGNCGDIDFFGECSGGIT